MESSWLIRPSMTYMYMYSSKDAHMSCRREPYLHLPSRGGRGLLPCQLLALCGCPLADSTWRASNRAQGQRSACWYLAGISTEYALHGRTRRVNNTVLFTCLFITNLKWFRSVRVASFDIVRFAIEFRILYLILIALHGDL